MRPDLAVSDTSRSSSSSFTSSVTSSSSNCLADTDSACVHPMVLVTENVTPSPPLLDPDALPMSSVMSSPASSEATKSCSPDNPPLTKPLVDCIVVRTDGEPRSSLVSVDDPQNLSSTTPVRDQSLSSTDFSRFLSEFEKLDIDSLAPSILHAEVRHLLDQIDFLTDKLSLALIERLFAVLSSSAVLMVLVSLLQDTRVIACKRPSFDAMKSFRYPYLVASILGSPKIAESVLACEDVLDSLLRILTNSEEAHPVVVTHVVNVLVTYLEYSPLPILERIGPDFIRTVAKRLYCPSVLELLAAILPSRSVDDVYTMDPSATCFDEPLVKALDILATGKCFHVFADVFTEAARRFVDASTLEEMGPSRTEDEGIPSSDYVGECRARSAFYDAEQRASNALEAYLLVIELTVRIVRIDRSSPSCCYLNPYANPSTACTLSAILDAGIRSYTKSEGQRSNLLIVAVDAVAHVLLHVEADADKRVASTFGQPPPICSNALTAELSPLLAELMYLATEKSHNLRRAARLRMHVLELMAVCQRVLDPVVFVALDRLRFGEVALKVLMLHPTNSMLHSAVTKAVEAALLDERSSLQSARHWLANSRLPEKIVKAWRREKATEFYSHSACGGGSRAPLVSALAQMACIVHHWMTCELALGHDPASTMGATAVGIFTSFFNEQLATLVESERMELGGAKPSKPRAQPAFGTVKRTANARRMSLHTQAVKSPSAHRFGYKEPPPPPPPSRSLVDIFDVLDDDDNELDFGTSTASFDDIRRAAEETLGGPD